MYGHTYLTNSSYNIIKSRRFYVHINIAFLLDQVTINLVTIHLWNIKYNYGRGITRMHNQI